MTWDNLWYSDRRAPTRPDLRVSDAERSEVADVLSKHYADGRLDAAEFKERLDQAMGAKRRSDFEGLLTDLPPVEAAPEPTRPRRGQLLAIVLVAFVVAGMWSAAFVPHFPWVAVVLLAVLIGRRRLWRQRLRQRTSVGPPW